MQIIDWILIPFIVIGAVYYLYHRFSGKDNVTGGGECSGCDKEGGCASVKSVTVE